MADGAKTIKWYKQTAVWAVIISVVALVLSQLPPIVDWIPKESFKVEISDQVKLLNNIGLPGYSLQIDIKNTGNRPLTISNLIFVVDHPSGKEKIYKAQTYSKDVGENQYDYPIVSTEVKVGESWSGLVLFYSTPSPSEEEESNAIRSKANESFFSKIRALPPKDYNPNYPVELDSKVAAEAVSLFNRRFEIEKGVYKVSIKGDINRQTKLLKQFEFTLYDDHIRTYKSQTDDYKYGFGLIASKNPNKEVYVTVSNIDK